MSTPTDPPHVETRADGKAGRLGHKRKFLRSPWIVWHTTGMPMRSSANPRHLTLGQIHSCLAYYHDHQEEMDRAIDEQLRAVEHLRGQQGESVLRAKIKARGPCLLMVSLYMDHHVPSAITAGLRNRGVDVLTAEEDGSARLDDDPLSDPSHVTWPRAFFSQDQDLLVIGTGVCKPARLSLASCNCGTSSVFRLARPFATWS